MVASVHDGIVNGDDESLLRQFLATIVGLPPEALEKCSVHGGPDACNILTWVVLKRGLEFPALAPGITPDGCRAFVGP